MSSSLFCVFLTALFRPEEVLKGDEFQLVKIALGFHHSAGSRIDPQPSRPNMFNTDTGLNFLSMISDAGSYPLASALTTVSLKPRFIFTVQGKVTWELGIFPAVYRNLSFLDGNIRIESYFFSRPGKQGRTRSKTQRTAKQQRINPDFHTRYLFCPAPKEEGFVYRHKKGVDTVNLYK